MKKICFLITILAISIPATARTQADDKQVLVAASAHPITVQAPDSTTASEILFFCDSFISHMKDRWNMVPLNLTPLRIVVTAQPKQQRDVITDFTASGLIVSVDWHEYKKRIGSFLCAHILRNTCTTRMNFKGEPALPRFMIAGIVGTFLQEKLDPSYAQIHHLLAQGHMIPLGLFITVDRPLSETLEQIFTLQSIYMLEYLAVTNYGSGLLNKFLLEYQTSADLALLVAARFHKKKNTAEFAADFFASMINRKPIFNVVTADTRFSTDSLHILLDEILLFRYNNNDGRLVTVKASRLAVADLVYIDSKQIDELIFQLRMLGSCGSNTQQRIIDTYITAFKKLKQGDFTSYYDNFYRAQYIESLLRKGSALTP